MAVMVVGVLARVLVAVKSPNILWPDEVFQTLEPGHRIRFGFGHLAWEFHDGIRAYLLPGFLAGIMKLTEPLSSGSIGYLVVASPHWHSCPRRRWCWR